MDEGWEPDPSQAGVTEQLARGLMRMSVLPGPAGHSCQRVVKGDTLSIRTVDYPSIALGVMAPTSVEMSYVDRYGSGERTAELTGDHVLTYPEGASALVLLRVTGGGPLAVCQPSAFGRRTTRPPCPEHATDDDSDEPWSPPQGCDRRPTRCMTCCRPPPAHRGLRRRVTSCVPRSMMTTTLPQPKLYDDTVDAVDRADRHIRLTLANAESPAVTCSMQLGGLVLLHLLVAHDPDIDVIFVDTGYHFPETLEFLDVLVDRLGPQPHGHGAPHVRCRARGGIRQAARPRPGALL